MQEIMMYARYQLWDMVDDEIMKFRKTKNNDLKSILEWLIHTNAFKDKLRYRKGLLSYAKLYHPKELFEGLE